MMKSQETTQDKIVRFIRIIMNSWSQAEITFNGAEMAFFALLSIVPILLIITNLIPLLPIDVQSLLDYIELMLPMNIYEIVEPMFTSYMTSSSEGAISISMLTTIWSASSLVNVTRIVLNRVYDVEGVDEKGFVGRILAAGFMLISLVGMMVVLFSFIFGERIIAWLQDLLSINFGILNIFITWRAPVFILILFVLFLLIYRFIPDHHLGFRASIPGAIFSTVGLGLLSEFFTFYTQASNNIAFSNATIGAFIVFMLYLYLNSIVILLGGLVNSVTFEWFQKKSVRETMLEQIEKQGKLAQINSSPLPEEEDVVLHRRIYKVKPREEREGDH